MNNAVKMPMNAKSEVRKDREMDKMGGERIGPIFPYI
jgi:hypothetical protein